MTTTVSCDICGNPLSEEPNKVTLKSRENLDGGEWAIYDACDECFKTFQAMCWSKTKQDLKELTEMTDEQKKEFIIKLNNKQE